MSRHVAAHEWADAFAGRLSEATRADHEAHAKTCERCASVRARVGRASDTFSTIRSQAAPDLPWDSVRARVHWSVSKERREQDRAPRRRMPRPAWVALGLGLAVAGGVGAAVATGVFSSPAPAPVAVAPVVPVAPTPTPVPAPKPAPAALVGLVNRIAGGDVTIDGVRPADPFARRLVAGSVLATGEGRVDVQFGDASAFALGPRSTLSLRRFDAEAIELSVVGTIDIEVAPRTAGQRFLVIAGEHTVEVRGTQFRVSHEGAATTVACRHGLVAVRDHAAQVEVGAARRIAIASGAALAIDQVQSLSVDELSVLAEATPIRVPLWDVEALTKSSAPLEVDTVGRRDVRVDGVELGHAPLVVRVMPGRHTVEAADHAGRFRRVGWVDVSAPSAGAAHARVEIPSEPAPTTGIKERRRQLQAGIDRDRLARCTRSIAKAGLSGTYVQVELAIDTSGAIGFLNVLDTDLPSTTASCVRDVLRDVRFGTGAAATWRERLDL